MQRIDKARFAALMNGLHLAYNRDGTMQLVELYWAMLEDLGIEQVEAAAKRHIAASKFFPTVAELRELARPVDDPSQRHPAPDEAWAIALAGLDEADSVATTRQILAAWAVASPVFSGDEVGARLAFKAAYTRLVAEDPEPGWFVSQGHDAQRRQVVIAQAEKRGLLTHEQAAEQLSALPGPSSLARLGEAAQAEADRGNAFALSAIAGIKAMLGNADEAGANRSAEVMRQAMEQRRSEMLERAAQFEAKRKLGQA